MCLGNLAYSILAMLNNYAARIHIISDSVNAQNSISQGLFWVLNSVGSYYPAVYRI